MALRLNGGELELVLALLEAGRTTDAARALGAEQSTVSRRLTNLERRLGVELFVRTPRGLVATPVAERLRPCARGVVASVRAAEQILGSSASTPSGVLRLAFPEALAHFALAPRLGPFLRRYPAIRVTLVDGPDLVDLELVHAHLAVRVVRPTSGDIVTKLLSTDQLAPFGTRRYVRGREARSLRWLGWDDSFAHLGEAQALAGLLGRPPDVAFGRMTTMLSAAKAGVGVVLTGRKLGALMGLEEAHLEGLPELPSKLWLAAPRALRHSPAVAAAWDWIFEQFAEFEADHRL